MKRLSDSLLTLARHRYLTETSPSMDAHPSKTPGILAETSRKLSEASPNLTDAPDSAKTHPTE